MENDFMKEVYFCEYCSECVHQEKKEDEDPCYDCLSEPARVDSHKPLYFDKK